MDYKQEEYQEELQKVQDRDFTHNWVSSSAFLFYLSVATYLAFIFGAAAQLYHRRYENSHPNNVVIQSSTLYTPQYQAPTAQGTPASK